MTPIVFRALWETLWPNRVLDEMAIRLVWADELAATDDGVMLRFLRAWAQQHPYPPTVAECRRATGRAVAMEAPASQYECCGERFIGWPAYARHCATAHPPSESTASPCRHCGQPYGVAELWRHELTCAQPTAQTTESSA